MNQALKDQARQVEQRLRDYFSNNYSVDGINIPDTLAALITALEAAEANAARYRYAQGRCWVQKVYSNGDTEMMCDHDIDAAIAQGAKTP